MSEARNDEVPFRFWLGTGDRPVPLEHVAQAVQSTKLMMADIERNVRHVDTPTAEWSWLEEPEIEIYCHANGIDRPTLERMTAIAKDGMKVALRSREAPADEAVWPIEFGDDAKSGALTIVNILASDESLIFEGDNEGDPEVVLVDQRPVRRLVSSVDGILESLNAKHRSATIYARITEWRTDNVVRAFLSKSKWLELFTDQNFFQRHVTIYGRVLYDADGVPKTISDVTNIDRRDGTTKLSELEGRLPGLTGHYSAQGFVRRLRGGDA